MQRFYFGIAIMATMVMVACGSPSDEPDPGDKDVPSLDLDYEDDAVTPDSQQDPGTPDEELPPVEDKPVKIEFLIDATFPQRVPAGQPYSFWAKVTNTADGSPAVGKQVGYEITGMWSLDGEEILTSDANLKYPQVNVGSDGSVENIFNAGTSLDVRYIVELTAEDAAPAKIEIVTIEMDCGCLVVTLGYQGTPGPSASYQVYAIPNTYKCADLTPTTPLTQVLATAQGLDIDAPIEFQCPPINKTVTLVAKGIDGCAFGFACKDDVVITDKKATETERCPNTASIGLHAIPMDLVATLNGSHRLDVAGLFKACDGVNPATDCANPATFADTACCYLRRVEDTFALGGDAFETAFSSQVESLLGSAANKATILSAVEGIVDGKLAGGKAAWASKYTKVSTAVVNALRSINMTSVLNLEEKVGDKIPGSFTWQTYNPLYWKAGCDPEDPEYFACGKLVLEMSEFGDVDYAPTIEETAFEATLAAGNRIIFEDHDVGLNLGRLVVFFASDVAARIYTGGQIKDGKLRGSGSRSVEHAAAEQFNCTEIVAAIQEQVTGWPETVTQEDFDALCVDTGTALMAPLATIRTKLIAPMFFRLQASGSYTDSNCDKVVDKIHQYEGTDYYTGAFHWSGSAAGEVSGSMTAVGK